MRDLPKPFPPLSPSHQTDCQRGLGYRSRKGSRKCRITRFYSHFRCRVGRSWDFSDGVTEGWTSTRTGGGGSSRFERTRELHTRSRGAWPLSSPGVNGRSHPGEGVYHGGIIGLVIRLRGPRIRRRPRHRVFSWFQSTAEGNKGSRDRRTVRGRT